MNKLRHLDLFSGIGGFALGLERTGGFETVAFCEIEPFPQKVLRKRWPGVPIYEDVRQLTGTRLAADGIAVDVITGGFPCQDLSTAGRQQGIEAERSGLWSELCRLIGELRPRYALVENVANLLSGPSEQRGAWFGRVLGDLAEVRYDAEWHCVPASVLGAPHVRDRAWIVAYPQSERQPEEGKLRLQQFAQWISRRCQTVDDPDNDEGLYNNQRRDIWHAQGLEAANSSDHHQKRIQRELPGPVQGFPEFSWCQDVRGIEEISGRTDLPEPLFWGTRDGVPDWVDRTGGLGNAILPQFPEIMGHAILEAEGMAA